MSTDRTVRLSPQQLALKLATRDAVKAAGGQEFVAHECSRAQSRISDYCSPNTHDFMPVDLVAKVESLGAGAPGHPHVTRALVRAQGAEFVSCAGQQPGTGKGVELARLLADFAGESSDVVRVLASGTLMPGQAAARIHDMTPSARKVLEREIDEVIDVLAGIGAELSRAQQGPCDTS